MLKHVPPHADRWASAAVAVLAAGVLSVGLVATGSGALTADGGPARLVPRTTAPPAAAPAQPEMPAEAPAPASAEAGSGVAPLGARHAADVRIAGDGPLAPDVLTRLEALASRASVSYRAGTGRVADQEVPLVAVDPSSFRRWAAAGTAEESGVWRAVARGEAVVAHEAAARLGLELGGPVDVTVPGRPAATLRLGALATTGLPGSDVVVSDEVGADLGLPVDSAVLLAADEGTDPVELARAARGVTGEAAQVDLLTPPADNPVAFLTGSRAAEEAFGAFSYRYFDDGTIEPEAAWVRDNIQTADLPVIGRVTCHRIMLEQLRGALTEVEARGLAGSLHTYDGCYVPRFIERNPRGSISLHTWGIAIDLDAATNGRGITGTMDPQVVEIFKRWGFRWGGDWQYTDPMHFELGAILER